MTHAYLWLFILHRITVVDGDHVEFRLSLLEGWIAETPDRLHAVLLRLSLAYEGLLVLHRFDVYLASGTCVVTDHLRALTLIATSLRIRAYAECVRDNGVIRTRWIRLCHLHV